MPRYPVKGSVALVTGAAGGIGLETARALRERGADAVEVRADVVDRFNDHLQASLKGTVWTAGHCQSWYLDEHGRNTTLWPKFSWSFRRITRRFDADAYALTSGNAAGAEGAPASADARVSAE